MPNIKTSIKAPMSAEYPASLPTEIWLSIIEQIPEVRTLNNLRRVSSRLYAIATPAAFTNLDLPDTVRGLKALREISQTPIVSRAVKTLKLVLVGPRDDHHRYIRGGITSGYKKKPVATMFLGVASHFPALQTLDIRVGRNVGQFVHANPVVGELMLVNATLHTTPPARLRALKLSGLTLFPHFAVWSEATAATLQALMSLELNFGLQTDPEIMDRMQVWDGAFAGPSSIVPLLQPWRRSGQWSLTHMILSASKECPAYHAFQSMHNTMFPNLVSLRIKHMVFRFPDPPTLPTEPGTLEEFIMRHTTLQALALDDCMLQTDSDANPRPYRSWAALCSQFSRALPHLVALSIYRHDFYPRPHDFICRRFPLGYASALGDVFDRSVFCDPAAAGRDVEALQVLEQEVRSRAERCRASLAECALHI
ncbi:hypothetical protein HWV62_12819 [Athelia sp. TMB]|nr:hypothetical protein HWV62_12819 [Athelia sp. TMB]